MQPAWKRKVRALIHDAKHSGQSEARAVAELVEDALVNGGRGADYPDRVWATMDEVSAWASAFKRAARTAWICPRCGTVNAAFAERCTLPTCEQHDLAA